MLPGIQIRHVTERRGEICEELLRSLPRWFGIESAIQRYVLDVIAMPMIVAYSGEGVVGFLSLHLRNDYTAAITCTSAV